MKTRNQARNNRNPAATLLGLPTELRTEILSYLFLHDQEQKSTPNPKAKWMTDEIATLQAEYLHAYTFYLNNDRITKTPTARGYPGHSEPKPHRPLTSQGVFLVCKVLREEALDVWFGRVHFTFVEFSRQARFLASQPLLTNSELTYGVAPPLSTSSWLHRVRNCEMRFDIETEWELRHFPSRLSQLMGRLDMKKVGRFRVVVKFEKTWFYHRPFSWRMGRVLRTRVSEQRAVGRGVWRGVVREVEGLGLRGWEGHAVSVWRTWEAAEGGLGAFEELGRGMGAVVRGMGNGD